MKSAEDFISEIFAFTTDMDDATYCDFLEEIGSACDDAAAAKREEMSRTD